MVSFTKRPIGSGHHFCLVEVSLPDFSPQHTLDLPRPITTTQIGGCDVLEFGGRAAALREAARKNHTYSRWDQCITWAIVLEFEGQGEWGSAAILLIDGKGQLDLPLIRFVSVVRPSREELIRYALPVVADRKGAIA